MPASLRVEVFPSDTEKCISFYTEVLRFKVINCTLPGYAYFQRDNVFIGADERLETMEEHNRTLGMEIVIEIDDLERERNRILENGWKLDSDSKMQIWGLRDVRIKDPDGYYLRIIERSAKELGSGRKPSSRAYEVPFSDTKGS